MTEKYLRLREKHRRLKKRRKQEWNDAQRIIGEKNRAIEGLRQELRILSNEPAKPLMSGPGWTLFDNSELVVSELSTEAVNRDVDSETDTETAKSGQI